MQKSVMFIKKIENRYFKDKKHSKVRDHSKVHSKYGSRGNQTKLEQNSQFFVNSVHFW